MRRVQDRNDRQAFTELVRRWEGPIQNACQRILMDVHRSEELTQDVFMRLYLSRAKFRADAKFSSYLWRIAINLCRDELRRREATRKFLDRSDNEASLPPSSNPNQQADQAERAEAVRQAIEALPDQLRIITVMRHYQDLKFREIAEALDIPEGTVKTRMVQAMRQLSSSLRSLNEPPTLKIVSA